MTVLGGFWGFSVPADPLKQCRRILSAQSIYAPEPAILVSAEGTVLGRRLFPTLPEDRYDRGPVAGPSWTLVADIRLDNRDELCSALGIPSSRAGEMADAAILLETIERWGDGAVERLVGDFAFAAFHRERRRLLLARDFLGQRPLHYHEGNGFFACASMPKGLLALPEIPPGADEETVGEFLTLIPEDGQRSFFKSVRRLPPGHLAIVTPGRVRVTRYWSPPAEPLRLKRRSDYHEAVRERLEEAVRARLRGAGSRVAAHLSGGLDSGIVAATAARLLAPVGRVTAFTAVPREGYGERMPRGRFGDEHAHSAAVAALYPNMEHWVVRTGGRSPIADLDRHMFLYDRPVLNLCNALWSDAILDAAKRQKLGILLVGQMGNLGVSYTGLEALPEMVRGARLIRLVHDAALLRRRGTSLESVAAHAIGPFLPAAAWRGINRLRGRRMSVTDYTAARPEVAARLTDRARMSGLDFSYRPRRDPLSTRLWALQRTDLANYYKGYLGGWGVDVRDPMADRRLIELCLSLPMELYLHDGWTRALAREAFADRLPEAVVRETRKGLQGVDWHEGLSAARVELSDELERIAAVPAAAEALDIARLRTLIQEWPEGGWHTDSVQARYRAALLRGVSAGHFLRKTSGSNR